jgi:hypothetical protein
MGVKMSKEKAKDVAKKSIDLAKKYNIPISKKSKKK